MPISLETVCEFQQVVREEYGLDLSLERAGEILRGWVGYFDILAKIKHKEKAKIHEESPG